MSEVMTRTSSAHPARRIARNISFLTAAHFSNRILGLVQTICLTRILGPGGFGRVSVALTLAGIFGVLTDLGTGLISKREIARKPEVAAGYLSRLATLRLLLAAASMVLMAIAAYLLCHTNDARSAAYLLAIGLIPGALCASVSSAFEGIQSMEYPAVISLGASFGTTLSVIGVLLAGGGILNVAWAMLAGSIFSMILALECWRRRFGMPKASWDADHWRTLMAQSAPLGIAGLFLTLYFQIDVLLLEGLTHNDQLVGLYNAAGKVVYHFQFVPAIFMGALFPYLSSLHGGPIQPMRDAIQKAFRILILAAIPTSVGLTLFARPLITLFFGAKYLPAATSSQILAWALFIIFLKHLVDGVLNAVDRQKINLAMTMCSCTLNVSLNLLVIPRYGIIGAALTTLATELFGLAFNSYFVARYVGIPPLPQLLWKPALAGALMAAAGRGANGLGVIPAILAAAIAYPVALWLLRAITPEDIQLVRRALGIGRQREKDHESEHHYSGI